MAQSQAVRQTPPREWPQRNDGRTFRQADRLDGRVEVVVLELRVDHGGQRLSLVLELQLHVHGRFELRESGIHLLLSLPVLGRSDHL